MITKTCELKHYTVDTHGCITFNCEHVFTEDGVELARSPDRYTIHPGDDTTGREQYVIDTVAAIQTPAVVTAWNEYLATLP